MEYKVKVLDYEYIFPLEELIEQIQSDIDVIGVLEIVPETSEGESLFSVNSALAKRMAIKEALESLLEV